MVSKILFLGAVAAATCAFHDLSQAIPVDIDVPQTPLIPDNLPTPNTNTNNKNDNDQPAAAGCSRDAWPRHLFTPQPQSQQDRYLTAEILSDEVIHFEFSALAQKPASPNLKPLYITPMVDPNLATRFCDPPKSLNVDRFTLSTAALEIEIDPTSLAVSVYEKNQSGEKRLLTKFATEDPTKDTKYFTWTREGADAIYGVAQGLGMDREGEEYSSDGNWVGKRITVPTPIDNDIKTAFGNTMVPLEGGNVGFTSFPIAYMVGPNNLHYAFFFDD
ncbi:hypothetical protein HK102_012949, partial [Quaeritorhiza haematococci]